jgi:integrase
MPGTIRTYQKCRVCGKPYPSSNGIYPIECCRTFPTKFYVRIKGASLYRNSKGQALRDWVTAQRALHEMQSRVEAGTFEPESYKRQSKTAFSVFWDQFTRRYQDRPSTLDKLNAINKHLSPFHSMQMRDIKAHMIDDWWINLDLSPRYKNDILVWFKTFMKYAHGLDIIEKVPYPMPKAIDIQADEICFLTEDEQLLVLDNLPPHDRQIFDFLFLTGVRVNEACGLYRSDVDWDRGVVLIKRTVKRDGSVGPVKNKKIRPIPLASVRHCLTFGKVVKISKFVKNNKYQFLNKWNRRYSDDYLRDTFKKACIAAGVEPIQLKNATRHSFGMGLLRKGFDIWQVSKAMNHSTIRMTENYVKMLGGEVAAMYGRSKPVLKNELDKNGTDDK